MRTFVLVIAALAIVTSAGFLIVGVKPASDDLTGITWQWTGTMASPGGPSAVPDPSAYTVEFHADRTFQAKADCQAVSGVYRRIPPGRTGPVTRLTMTPGSSDPVACGAGSLSEVYLRSLGSAWGYTITDGQLTMELVDGGSMTFR